ncbi:MAG: cyclopropane-fatty-acyl-phospholipid synthase family protein [Acidimicrobiales bacterium]|jgi:cyclopropane-fatty-acyl-phospholipid synthase
MPPLAEDTIAPEGFLPARRQRFSRLARWIFLRLVSAKRMRDAGTLQLNEDWRASRASRTIGAGELRAEMTIHDRDAYAAIVFGGSRGMGRSYVNGLWDSEDVSAVVRYLFRVSEPGRQRQDRRARHRMMVLGVAPSWLSKLFVGWRHEQGHSSDRKNIHAHYDLSNEFFELMLDETLAYSCAIFKDDSTTLHEAQVEKFDRICRKLGLSENDHVLEIGTGWGGFALHAAQHYGAKVTTTTISENQRHFAEQRVKEAGLGHLITVLGEHYRDLQGSFDALVSVEMIEAVNWRHYEEFFKKCSTLLTQEGRMALQAITIAEQSFERAKVRKDFIRDLIFPGGCLPSIAAIMSSIAGATDLRLVDLDDIGLHYATTLRLWKRNVDERFEEIRSLGFDDRFKRLWDMYLRYCEGAFLERHISDVQLIFHKPGAPVHLGYRVS